MKLITETNFNDPLRLLTEANANPNLSPKYYIEGIFLQQEIKNGNGRSYPGPILESEVDRYTKSHIIPNSAWGELNHPSGATINLDRVSHRTVSLKREGNNYIGKALIIEANTPGMIAKNLIESGGRLGVSSRALGSVRMIDGVNIVQEDLHLITPADIVADPSAPDAFINGIMEGKEWVWDNGMIIESTIYNLKKGIEESFNPNKDAEERKQLQEKNFKLFLDFLSL